MTASYHNNSVVYAALACEEVGIVAFPILPSIAAIVPPFCHSHSSEGDWLNETARILGWIGLVMGVVVCCVAVWMWRIGWL